MCTSRKVSPVHHQNILSVEWHLCPWLQTGPAQRLQHLRQAKYGRLRHCRIRKDPPLLKPVRREGRYPARCLALVSKNCCSQVPAHLCTIHGFFHASIGADSGIITHCANHAGAAEWRHPPRPLGDATMLQPACSNHRPATGLMRSRSQQEQNCCCDSGNSHSSCE